MPVDTDKEANQDFNSELEKFKEAVAIARNMIGSRDITVNMPLALGVVLTVDEAVIDDKLRDSSIDREKFEEILTPEMSNIITAILSKRTESYIDFVLEDIEDEAKDKQRELVKAKILSVKENIIDKALMDRYKVRNTSKADLLEDISWEINEKQYDNGKKIESLRYATIRLVFKENLPSFRAIGGTGHMLSLFSNERSFSALLDCSLGDIKDLIGVLRDIQKELQNSEETG